VALNIDGRGECSASTGIRFFDHMLDALARHAAFDARIAARGDGTGDHHTVEDTGITLGEALKKALGSKQRIQRFGWAIVPMDDALATVALDLAGRPFVAFNARLRSKKLGDMSAENVRHFFESFAYALGANVHASVDGRNDHHKCEALFKALARALRMACSRDERVALASTKGVLE
jgi:imidazoleglycerol-phosphate dehydratase